MFRYIFSVFLSLQILLKRQSQFYEQYVAALIQEASKLHMKKEEIISLIERGFEHEQNSD